MNKVTATLLMCFCMYGNLTTPLSGHGTSTTRAPKIVQASKKHHHSSRKRVHRSSGAAYISRVALLDSIAQLESSTEGDWKANNHNLYIGRYQIAPHVLTGQGYSPRKVRRIFRRFAKHPDVFPAHEQETTVKVWMGIIEDELEPDINKFTGKRVRGIRVTKAGILAAGHRVGVTGVHDWLHHGHCHYTGRVDKTMRRYARTQMRETFKTRATASFTKHEPLT